MSESCLILIQKMMASWKIYTKNIHTFPYMVIHFKSEKKTIHEKMKVKLYLKKCSSANRCHRAHMFLLWNPVDSCQSILHLCHFKSLLWYLFIPKLLRFLFILMFLCFIVCAVYWLAYMYACREMYWSPLMHLVDLFVVVWCLHAS